MSRIYAVCKIHKAKTAHKIQTLQITTLHFITF